MALYTKAELAQHRKNGLDLTDEENESYGNLGPETKWSKEEFESWLSTRNWDESVKESHRKQFKGVIYFCDGGRSFNYG